MGQKPAKQPPRPDYLAAVRKLPCVICWQYGMPQVRMTTAHHPIHGRYSAKKSPDTCAIPLCADHHQGLLPTEYVALHQAPSKWRRLYGPDTDYIEQTQEKLRHLLD